jgi:hypothetical protein
MSEAYTRGNAAALGAADWLCLAAAPTFAIMALLTGILAGGPSDMFSAGAQDASVLSGMVPMYVLMSAFHSAPWLRLISRPTKRWPPVLIRCSPDRGAEPSLPVNALRGDEQRGLVGVRGSGDNSTGR